MDLLQIATGITKCDDYYNLRQYNVLFHRVVSVVAVESVASVVSTTLTTATTRATTLSYYTT